MYHCTRKWISVVAANQLRLLVQNPGLCYESKHYTTLYMQRQERDELILQQIKSTHCSGSFTRT